MDGKKSGQSGQSGQSSQMNTIEQILLKAGPNGTLTRGTYNQGCF